MQITGLTLALLDIPAGATQEFNRWYDLDHLPEHVAKRDVVMGRRYVATQALHDAAGVEGSEKHAPYATIYFFGGDIDFMSEEALNGWRDKDRIIRKDARYWNAGGGVFSGRWRLADVRVRASELISDEAMPHLPHRGMIALLGRVPEGRTEQALAWWDEKYYPDLFSVPGLLAVLRCSPDDSDPNLMLHIAYTECDALAAMDGIAALRRRQARLGRYPAYDGSYEPLFVLPYQRIVPLEYDFEPGEIGSQGLPPT